MDNMPEIKVYQSLEEKKEYRVIEQHSNETVGQALQRVQYPVTVPCGGHGTCGKCRFLVLEGETRITEEEKKHLSKEQLAQGERLLCRARFIQDGAICLTWADADRKDAQIQSVGMSVQGVKTGNGSYEAAVDIGTTTIAMALVERETGRIVSSLTRNNSQRRYGADVLSRIQKANEGGALSLKRLIWEDLTEGLDVLLGNTGQEPPERMIISANTTMEHLLMGDSCEKLGKAPFLPADLRLRTAAVSEIWEEAPQRYRFVRLTVLPGVSAFVGADIVSGMYACGMYEQENPALFLDLGTNGEMVVGTKDGFLATATAVGPAFEGGNISCGCPGIPGAISSVSILGQRVVTHTIGNQKPVGICGTGILELTYELYKNGIMDETGTLRETYRENGYPVAEMENGDWIFYTQNDIRQLQMAKAAVRSGIEILLQEMNLTVQDVRNVYLAGGLGYKLNVYKAAGIGLIPRELKEKTVAAGNTSLQGAVQFLQEAGAAEHMEAMLVRTAERNLALHPAFEAYYLRFLNFDR